MSDYLYFMSLKKSVDAEYPNKAHKINKIERKKRKEVKDKKGKDEKRTNDRQYIFVSFLTTFC